MEGVVFEDVPEALQRWHASGVKVNSLTDVILSLLGYLFMSFLEVLYEMNCMLEGSSLLFANIIVWYKNGSICEMQVYIYSSGSRLAQRLIFGKTAYGDLRKYLSGFFDTFVG